MNEHFYFTLVLLVSTGSQASAPCADLDTSACQQMATQRKDMCSDPVLARSACPRYCNLCPLQCYYCDTMANDLHPCNTTRLCAESEVCMRKEIRSYIDGHREYQQFCGNKQYCDGSQQASMFGKRHVQSRDVIISCCNTDLCNALGDLMMSQPPVQSTTHAPVPSHAPNTDTSASLAASSTNHHQHHHTTVAGYSHNDHTGTGDRHHNGGGGYNG